MKTEKMEPDYGQQTSIEIEATDEHLIAQTLGGRDSAYDILTTRYRDRIYNYTYYMLQDKTDAEDITQETFIRAYFNLSKFRQEASFLTWLFRIAKNVCYTYLKKHIRHKRLKRAVLEEQQEYSRCDDRSPEKLYKQYEIQHSVLQAMDQLKPKHKEVLVLKEINGIEVQRVAEILKVPEGTVKSRLNRARLELQKVLNRQNNRWDQAVRK